jgi:transcription initiation factor TFIIA small subunit
MSQGFEKVTVDSDYVILQGHLDTYRFCDDVWTFIIKDIKFKMDSAHQFDAEKIKIVACQAKDKAP